MLKFKKRQYIFEKIKLKQKHEKMSAMVITTMPIKSIRVVWITIKKITKKLKIIIPICDVKLFSLTNKTTFKIVNGVKTFGIVLNKLICMQQRYMVLYALCVVQNQPDPKK